MSFSHLIAVNCHPYHKLPDISAGLASVARAVGLFRQHCGDRIEVRVFWHNPDRAPESLREQILADGFTLVERPHQTNGQNLNSQIETALEDGFDLFYRVDSDDTVTAQRFLRQADLLKTGLCDLCGAGLRYKPEGGSGFVMMPEIEPGPRDYIENKYLLHPSMALRLDAWERAGLKYWTQRLEDKALLLQARRAGLRVRNIPVVAGGYNVGPRSRNRLVQKWIGFKLNAAFLWHTRALHFLPYATALFCAQVLLGSHVLRLIRHRLHRRSAADLRNGASQTGSAADTLPRNS